VLDMMELIFCTIRNMVVWLNMLCDVLVEQISLYSGCMLRCLNFHFKEMYDFPPFLSRCDNVKNH
jgi:hypothetical protein